MRKRDAERAARRFIAAYYTYYYEQWEFDICEELSADGRKKSWSFGLTPDQDHSDYEPYRTLTGYVHVDGTVEGLY